MTKDEFSKKILKCSYNLFSQVLAGTRNFGYLRAGMAARIFETEIEVWLDSKRTTERVEAWEKFNKM